LNFREVVLNRHVRPLESPRSRARCELNYGRRRNVSRFIDQWEFETSWKFRLSWRA